MLGTSNSQRSHGGPSHRLGGRPGTPWRASIDGGRPPRAASRSADSISRTASSASPTYAAVRRWLAAPAPAFAGSVQIGPHHVCMVARQPIRYRCCMIAREIPSSGEAIPVIGLGTWQTFDVSEGAGRRAALQDVLRTFVAQGGRVVDTSPMYGNAERVLGDLFEATGLRPELFVATKVWTSGRAEGVRQMESSLQKLRTERVDLMQVHNLLDVETHLATLDAWKQDGRVRYVGITHYTASAHEALARLVASRPLDFLQVNYSVGEPEAERRLLPLAQERGVAVLVNRPFGGGGLLRRLRGRPMPAGGRRAWLSDLEPVAPQVRRRAPAVTCAIPATSQVEHLLENMAAGDGALPTDRQRAQIAEAAR